MSEDKPTTPYRGRLAPTPSGYLHEGHILTFRTAWERARENEGKLLFRMDDLDPNRCTAAYASACIEDMRGMGLDWDEGPDLGGASAPYEQSKRSSFYVDAMKKLYQLGLIYPCKKSRKDIRAHGLLDTTGNEYLYPESFRSSNTDIKNSEFPEMINWRFLTQAGKKVEFLDAKKAGQSSLWEKIYPTF